MARDPVDLRPQAARGHIEQRKDARSEKIDEADPEAGTAGVLEAHFAYSCRHQRATRVISSAGSSRS